MKRLMRILVRLMLVVLAAASVGSCYLAKIKDLSINSFGVKYVVPTSTRQLSGVLLLGVDNPSISFTLSELDGVIKVDGRPMVTVTATELPVQKRSVQVYEVPCTITLVDGVSILDVLKVVATRSSTLEGLTADATLHVQLKNGLGKTLTFNELDLSQFSS